MSVTTSGVELKSGQRPMRRVVELLSSMRFAIALLVILSIASIIGTVLTQDDPYPNYVNQFGPFWADIFRSLSLYTVYSAWWFMLILGFLMVSVSLCVIRNAPKMIADMKSWKDKVRESSLRAFHHKGEFAVSGTREQTTATLAKLSGRLGYRFVTRESNGSTLIAAKRGALTKLGYISAHLAIVIICLGGLLDSNLPIKLQMWMFNKTPINSNSVINDIPPEHRLSESNPTFRGYAWVPEGEHVSTAILNQPNGSLIQDLPFSIQLNKFIVDYYSTGMPKLFASDIVVIDHKTGAKIPARVEVNKPFEYDGVSIYQSSFQDGGSQMQMTAYPMTGDSAKTAPFGGTIGNSAPLGNAVPGADGQTIEFADFRAINVENVSNGSGANDARGVAHQSLKEAFDERLGSGAKTSKPLDLHNVGPSVQYKVRGKDGQAREYNNYMLPVDVSGEKMFLAGMRIQSGRSVPLSAHSRRPGRHGQGMDEPARDAGESGHARYRRTPFRTALGAGIERGSVSKHLEESALRVTDPLCRRRQQHRHRCRAARISAASRRSRRSLTGRCRRASRKRLLRCCCACSRVRPGTCGNWPVSRPASPTSRRRQTAACSFRARLTQYLTAFCMVRRSIYNSTHSGRCKLRYFS